MRDTSAIRPDQVLRDKANLAKSEFLSGMSHELSVPHYRQTVMALKLSDCPPSLHAAILAQLEKEGRHLPTTTVHYAMAYQIGGTWRVGPETENLVLI
jgi:hypothetical protein